MTVNTQRLTTLQQSLETLLTEKRTLNSKVVSDSYNHFKNCLSKSKAGQHINLQTPLKRLEQSLKNEGAYKNVKTKFEQIKTEILEHFEYDTMKAVKRENDKSHSPQRQDKRAADKTSNRARTVTLAHAQDRQNARNGPPISTIKRPVIQPETHAALKVNKTPVIEVSGRGSNGRGSPEALVGLNKTISRLFDQLEIDKPKHGQNVPHKDTSKSMPKPTKTQTKTTQKVTRTEDAKDVKLLATKLRIFEDEFQKRKSSQEETLHGLETEIEKLKAALVKKEQELDRIRSTQSIAHRAKGKTVERMAEIHEHERKDMIVKLQTLELNIKKNLEGNLKESDDNRHRQVLDTLSSEILRVCTIVNKRNKIHRTRSEASNMIKEKDSYDDLLPRIVNLGEEIQNLQKTKSELSKDNNDLQIWKSSFAEVSAEADSLWKEVYSNKNFPDVRNISKSIDSDSPRSKAGPIKAKLATAKALLINNTKKLEDAEKRLSGSLGSLNANDVLKKVAGELNKLQSDYNSRPSNSRLSLRSISTNKSDELQETTEITNSVKNIRKLIQDFDSRISEYEKTIKDHDNDLEILRRRVVKLGAGVLNDDNIHEPDSESDDTKAKNPQMYSEKLDALMKKLEIFDERLKQLQVQNRMYKRQLEGKDASSHRLAVMETDLHELCNILRVPDNDRHTESGDKLKSQIKMCKTVSRKLVDEKENIERKLAKAIIDITEVTKHVATLHHHVRKIRHKSDDGRKNEGQVIQTAVEEAQLKLNDITQNVDEISMEKDEFKRKHTSSVEDLSRLAQKIHLLRQEVEGQKNGTERPKSGEINYLADVEALKQNLWKTVGEKKAYIDTIDEKSQQIADMKEQMSKLQIQVTVRETEIKEKNNELRKLTDVASEITKENKQLQENIEALSREKRQLEKEVENLKSNLDKTSNELKDTQEEKNNLLRRLSKAMGSKLGDGNPTVANLSDPYRPEKMAEKFSQLYDEEWTNAFEILTSMFSMDEKMAVDCLFNIVKEGYHFCLKLAGNQITDVTRVLLMLYKDGVKEMSNPEKIHLLNQDENRQIKDTRKQLAKYSASTVIGLYQTSERKSYITEEQIEQCEQFVNKCIELCWLMAVNDPPVHMLGDLKSGEVIDKNHFRYFTSSGDYVEYIVWPALLLHKNGPVICKGVVQAI